MSKMIDPSFDQEIDGFNLLGRAHRISWFGGLWSRSRKVIYRCANCGDMMQASNEDYWNCHCGSMSLDVDARRFSSCYGIKNILVYIKKKNTIWSKLMGPYLKIKSSG